MGSLTRYVGQASELVDRYDLTVNEERHDWSECGELVDTFVVAGKPVLNAEYADSLGEGLRTLILPLDLDDSFRVSCDQ